MAPHDEHRQTRTHKHTHITDMSQIMYIGIKSDYRPAIPVPPPTPTTPVSQRFLLYGKDVFRLSAVRKAHQCFLTALRRIDFATCLTFLTSLAFPDFLFSRENMCMCTIPLQPSPLPCPLSINKINETNGKLMNILKSIENTGTQLKSLEIHENQTKPQKHIFKTNI